MVVELEGGTWEYNTRTADKMLVPEVTEKAQNALRIWEGALLSLISDKGLEGGARYLSEATGQAVSSIVLHGWAMSAWSRGATILPQHVETFRRAAETLGLTGAEIEEAWRLGRLVRVTRRKAGRAIRDRMRQQLLAHRTEMEASLTRSGSYTLEATGDVGRRLYVLLVTSVADAGLQPISLVDRIWRESS